MTFQFQCIKGRLAYLLNNPSLNKTLNFRFLTFWTVNVLILSTYTDPNTDLDPDSALKQG